MVVMLDLSAAFGFVDQEQLLFLFECEYRIQGRALSWFRSCLDGRTCRFQIDGASSECVPLWCGEPQGSVLGTILFTMCTAPINRILQRHGISYHTYADDIQIYLSFNPSI